MDIERHLIMDSADAKPIISRVITQGDRVEHPPVRACVQAELFAPGLLVEIMVRAAR